MCAIEKILLRSYLAKNLISVTGNFPTSTREEYGPGWMAPILRLLKDKRREIPFTIFSETSMTTLLLQTLFQFIIDNYKTN